MEDGGWPERVYKLMAGVDKEGARGEDVKAAAARETGSERGKKRGKWQAFRVVAGRFWPSSSFGRFERRSGEKEPREREVRGRKRENSARVHTQVYT